MIEENEKLIEELADFIAKKLTWYSLWWREGDLAFAAKDFFTDTSIQSAVDFSNKYEEPVEYAQEGLRLIKYLWDQSQKPRGPYSFSYYKKNKARFAQLPRGFGSLTAKDKDPTGRLEIAIRKLVIQSRVLHVWPELTKWTQDKKFFSCADGVYLPGSSFRNCGLDWCDFMKKVDEVLHYLYAGENDTMVYHFFFSDNMGEARSAEIKPYVQNKWGVFRELNPITEAERYLIAHFSPKMIMDEKQKEPMEIIDLLGSFDALVSGIDEWIKIGKDA